MTDEQITKIEEMDALKLHLRIAEESAISLIAKNTALEREVEALKASLQTKEAELLSEKGNHDNIFQILEQTRYKNTILTRDVGKLRQMLFDALAKQPVTEDMINAAIGPIGKPDNHAEQDRDILARAHLDAQRWAVSNENIIRMMLENHSSCKCNGCEAGRKEIARVSGEFGQSDPSLKPCRKCGAEAKIVTTDHSYRVECTNCNQLTGGYAAKQIAADAWNGVRIP